ncbi:MAG: hypothetical protein M3Y85_01430 [Bacteroidota bacterium]|nr:hypothetical protein [Bacteroidota bacterium]
MRKVYTLAMAAICISHISHAQITKGSTFIGGSLSVFSDKSEFTPNSTLVNKATNWSIKPQIGKAISENKIAGIFLNFGKSKYIQTTAPANSSESINTVYGGGFFYRSYYPLSKKFFLFGDAGLGINFGKDERSANNGTTNYIYYKGKSTEGNFALAPGLSFAATKKLHLELALNNLLYFSYQSSNVTEYNSSTLIYRTTNRKIFSAIANANAFNNIAIGVRLILPSKTK